MLMNSPAPVPSFHDTLLSFNSLDCIDLVVNVVGDSTVRPLRPELLRQALAERERLARWEDYLKQHQTSEKPRDLPEGKNGPR
jgi:hypothetical protein